MFVPPIEMLLIDSGMFPALKSVTDCAGLVLPTARGANVSDAPESDADATPPAPVSETDCTPTASLTTTFAERATAAFGVIVTFIAQLAPAARLLPQSFV